MIEGEYALVGGKKWWQVLPFGHRADPVKENGKRACPGATSGLTAWYFQYKEHSVGLCTWSLEFSKLIAHIHHQCTQECCQPGSLCTWSELESADPAAQLAAECLVKMAALKPGCKRWGETGRRRPFYPFPFMQLHVNSFKGIHHFLLYMDKKNKERFQATSALNQTEDLWPDIMPDEKKKPASRLRAHTETHFKLQQLTWEVHRKIFTWLCHLRFWIQPKQSLFAGFICYSTARNQQTSPNNVAYGMRLSLSQRTFD